MHDFRNACTKIIGVGKSYDYNWPQLSDRIPEPLIFIKPPSSLSEKEIEIPQGCEVYHEVELGVVIGKKGRNIPTSRVMEHVEGYALALDMTAKNVQAVAAQAGHPWSICKGFDTFATAGKLLTKEQIPDPQNVQLELQIDNKVVQRGSTSSLIYTIPELVAYISGIFTLQPGDIIMTGTPPGVGPVARGNVLTASIQHANGAILDQMVLQVVERERGYHFGGYWKDSLQ